MKTLCIAPCGKSKIWHKFPDAGSQKARDVYTGPYASTCIEYGQFFYPGSWCILSAKYGFLFPDDIISGPYDVTFKKRNTNPITIDKLLTQKLEKGLGQYTTIVVLGGELYVNIVDILFMKETVRKPLIGLRLGKAINKLKAAINNKTPL